jgi:cytochrome b6-f complex iron-sulfur subunit
MADPSSPKPSQKPGKSNSVDKERRSVLGAMFGSFMGVGFTSLGAAGGLWVLGSGRFMFPNVLAEPPTRFKVGLPDAYPPGFVETRFKESHGVWVVHGLYQGRRQIYALRTVCTHLGCITLWLESEQRFKCPCHGSGFYKNGIHFEGPAPRPLERFAIRVAEDGQLEVDRSRVFREELGQWDDPDSYVVVS